METQIIKQERIFGIEFARACCAIGIIIFHYFCHSAGSFKFLFATANDSWGHMFVTAFFAISGAVLYYNYPQIESLKVFYFKRWKSIFPAYYLCFLFFFLRNIFQNHKLFYAGNPLKLAFTLLGMDGYFLYKYSNYYIVGEWFLGAIIMLYLLYPFLVYVMNKKMFIIPIFLIMGYVSMYCTDLFEIMKFTNLITCMTSFYIGMIFIKFKDLFFKNKISWMVSLLILVVMRFVKFPNFVFFHQIQGLSLLVVLVQLGNCVMMTRWKSFFTELSKMSFSIFLFQHVVILDMQGVFNPEKWYKILVILFATIVLTLICAKILLIVVNYLTNSKLFKILESKFAI